MDDVAKIRVKVGSIEIEYEGDPSFLKNGLEDLLVTLGDLSVHSSINDDELYSETDGPAIVQTPPQGTESNNQSFNLSTNAIATHYGAKSASDLVLCAVIQLQLVQGKVGCSRKEITAAMKEANNFYKASMRGGNLSSAFSSLAKKKKLNELHGGNYSLTVSEKQIAETQLAGIE